MNLRELAYQASLKELDHRIATTKQLMDDADASSQNETKSSAGDKFETGRAMMQREKENSKVKLIKLMELKHQFQSVPQEKKNDKISTGSLVESNKGFFYISIGLGKIKTEKFSFIAVSPEAPLVRNLLGKEKGDIVTFNGQQINIQDIN